MNVKPEETARDVTAEVRSVVAGFAPSWALGKGLADDQPLGLLGLGLDSVAIVELLVACERQFGIPFPDSLLEGEPVTVGKLINHLSAGRRPAAGG